MSKMADKNTKAGKTMADIFGLLQELGGSFDSGMRNGGKKAINAVLRTEAARYVINSKIKRYASIHSLALVDGGIEIRAQLLGSQDIFTVTVADIDIDTDRREICVHHCDSDMPWVKQLLCRFVANETFKLDSVPPWGVTILSSIISLLK